MNERHVPQEPRPARSKRRRAWYEVRAALALALVVGGVTLAAGRAPEGVEDVDEARAVLERWVEARRLISQEKRDWALAKELLNDRIDVVQTEIDSLLAKIEEAEEKIAQDTQERGELLASSASLQQASDAMRERIVRLERRTKELLTRIPAPIREDVRPFSQQIPDDPETTRLTLSKRFQYLLGVLNLVNKFHSKITTSSEVRTLPDGTTVEVTALYLGISQGFYVNAAGTVAGIGRPSEEGWEWEPANESAAAIARAVRIHGNEESAAFVQVPVHLESPARSPER